MSDLDDAEMEYWLSIEDGRKLFNLRLEKSQEDLIRAISEIRRLKKRAQHLTDGVTRGDLKDEDLARFSVDSGLFAADDVEVRMADEIRRHRAARTASEERVRAVVRAVLSEDRFVGMSTTESLRDAIATRAAKQLAGAVPAALTQDEHDDIDALLSSLREQREAAIEHAALTRLLSTSIWSGRWGLSESDRQVLHGLIEDAPATHRGDLVRRLCDRLLARSTP